MSTKFQSRTGFAASSRFKTPLFPEAGPVKPFPEADEAFTEQVSESKHALPPSRKIISLSDALFALTPNPVVDPSRQCDSGTSTHTQVLSMRPVTGAPASKVLGAPSTALGEAPTSPKFASAVLVEAPASPDLRAFIEDPELPQPASTSIQARVPRGRSKVSFMIESVRLWRARKAKPRGHEW